MSQQDTTNTTLQERIDQDHITIFSEQVDHNPNMDQDAWAQTASHYKVTLSRPVRITSYRGLDKVSKRSLTTYFSMGSAHWEAPEAADVLDSLLSDATSASEGFEDWCADLGYDTDSRKAERTYKACQRIETQVRRFLGDDFDDYAYNTERL